MFFQHIPIDRLAAQGVESKLKFSLTADGMQISCSIWSITSLTGAAIGKDFKKFYSSFLPELISRSRAAFDRFV